MSSAARSYNCEKTRCPFRRLELLIQQFLRQNQRLQIQIHPLKKLVKDCSSMALKMWLRICRTVLCLLRATYSDMAPSYFCSEVNLQVRSRQTALPLSNALDPIETLSEKISNCSFEQAEGVDSLKQNVQCKYIIMFM